MEPATAKQLKHTINRMSADVFSSIDVFLSLFEVEFRFSEGFRMGSK